MPRPRNLTLLAGLALLVPAPAHAAFSQPRTIAVGNPQVAEPTITFDGAGRALLSARLTTMAQGAPSRGFSRLFGQQPDGGFAGRGRVVLAAPPAAFATSRLALLRRPLTAGNTTIEDFQEPTSLGYSFGRTGGSLEVDVEAYRRLTTKAERGDAALAANARGDVAAVWVERHGDHDHLVAALRRPGEAFGAPAVIVGSGLVTAPAVAVAANGDLLVAYQHNAGGIRRIEARVRRAGHSWGKPQQLGGSNGFSEVAVAAAPNGRMLVAWGTQDGGEEANQPWRVRAALRPAGPRSFHAEQEIETSEGIDRPAGRVVAAMGSDGTASVAWSGIDGRRFPHTFPARVATAGSSLRFGAPQTLAPNAAVGDVAAGTGSAAAVAWATLPELGDYQTTDQVLVAQRAAGTDAFGPGEPVSPAERATDPRVALDPDTGRPAVVWISRASGRSQRFRFSEASG